MLSKKARHWPSPQWVFGDLGVNSGQGTVGGHLYSNSSPPGLWRLATCPARVFTAVRDGDEWRRLSGTKHRRKLIKVSHKFRGHCHKFYCILRIFDLMVIMCFLSTYFHQLQNCHWRVFACILLGDILYFVFVCHNICIGYLACKDLHPQAVLRIFANQPHHPSDKVLQINIPISVWEPI